MRGGRCAPGWSELGADSVREDLAKQPVRDSEGAFAGLEPLGLAPRLERDDGPRRAGRQPQQRLDLAAGIALVRGTGGRLEVWVRHGRGSSVGGNIRMRATGGKIRVRSGRVETELRRPTPS